jgi:hypothetical protein
MSEMAERKRFLLRIDPGLYAELRAWAAAEFRSVNAQVEFLLRQAVEVRRRGGAGRTRVDGDGEREGAKAARRD